MKLFDPEEGYDLYADQYRDDHKHLDSFDWDTCRNLLFARFAEISAQSGPGFEREPGPMAKTGSELSAHASKTPSLLDLGCGDGRLLKRLVRAIEAGKAPRNLGLEGWDISAEMLRIAKKNCGPGVVFRKKDIMSTSGTSESTTSKGAVGPQGNTGRTAGNFDIVTALFVLVHVAIPSVFFDNALRLVRDGGFLLCNNIRQRSAPVFRSHGVEFQIAYHDHENSEIENAAKTAGFELVEFADTPESRVFLFKA